MDWFYHSSGSNPQRTRQLKHVVWSLYCGVLFITHRTSSYCAADRPIRKRHCYWNYDKMKSSVTSNPILTAARTWHHVLKKQVRHKQKTLCDTCTLRTRQHHGGHAGTRSPPSTQHNIHVGNVAWIPTLTPASQTTGCTPCQRQSGHIREMSLDGRKINPLLSITIPFLLSMVDFFSKNW